MKRFMIISACIALLLPIRIAVSLSSRARANTDVIKFQVADVVNQGLSKAQLKLKANARVAANTLKTQLGVCVDNGINNVKAVAREIAPEPEGKDGKESSEVPFRTYIDISIIVAVLALAGGRKRVHC